VEAFDVSIAVFGLFLAGVVKGLTGIGYATCALPFLVAALGLNMGMALVTIPAVVSNFAILSVGDNISAVIQRFWRFYIAIIPGIGCGAILLGAIDPGRATGLLSILTLSYVAIALTRPELRLPPWLERPLALPAGFLNGVLTGLTGSQVMPLMPYMMALRLPSAEQVQAVNLSVVVASLVLLIALISTGVMTPGLLLLSAAGAVPAILGVHCGDRLRGDLPAQAFRRMTLVVLAAIAVSLLMRGHVTSGGETACSGSEAASAVRRDCTRTAASPTTTSQTQRLNP
jgi:uncharacterized protein